MPRLEAPEGYSIAAPHNHTNRSDGLTSPIETVEAAHQRGYSVFAITDHDTFSAITPKVLERAEELGIEVVAGIEIQCKGFKHLLAFFPEKLKKPIPHSRPLEETAKIIRDRDGIIIAAHPMSGKTDSLSKDQVLKLMGQGLLDGIEVMSNSSSPKLEAELINFTNLYDDTIAQLGSSDSHRGGKDNAAKYTIFPGRTAQDFLKAIKDKATIAVDGIAPQPITQSEKIKRNFKAIFVLGFKRFFRLPF